MSYQVIGGAAGVEFRALEADALLLDPEKNLMRLQMKSRFAIRATKFGPETDAIKAVRGKENFHGLDENAREL
jgi:hypothetical protein